jgi:predicted metal-binding membrane protein
MQTMSPAPMYRALIASPTTQRNLVLVLLLAAAAACWAWLLGRGGMAMAMASPTMGLPAASFLAMWAIMMIAMMFPTAAPMVLTFHRIEAGKRARGEAFVSTWLFVAGYIAVWAAAGIAAYLGALAAEGVAARAGLSAVSAARIGGALLVVAGLYQLTPLKNMCLAKCRSPIAFVLTAWRDGALGAVRMGVVHGATCLGCCWLLMAILFPLGIMNLAAMAIVMVVVFAEKALPRERVAVWGTAAALVLYGTLVIAVPRALPTFAAPSAAMEMPGITMPAPLAPPAAKPINMPGMSMPAGTTAPAKR